jgi:hypothetical protein
MLRCLYEPHSLATQGEVTYVSPELCHRHSAVVSHISLYGVLRLPKALLPILHGIANGLLLRHLTDDCRVCGQRTTRPAFLYAPQPPSYSSRCVAGVVVRRPRVPWPPLSQVLILDMHAG